MKDSWGEDGVAGSQPFPLPLASLVRKEWGAAGPGEIPRLPMSPKAGCLPGSFASAGSCQLFPALRAGGERSGKGLL